MLKYVLSSSLGGTPNVSLIDVLLWRWRAQTIMIRFIWPLCSSLSPRVYLIIRGKR